MNPEQQIIAIAEACGWKPGRSPLQSRNNPSNDAWTRDGKQWIRSFPSYLNDLNAMHEAEKYLCDLSDDVSPWDTYDEHLGANPTHATAAQRAEAFLRTLNLWTNDS